MSGGYGDRERLRDLLTHQQQMAEGYSRCAGLCSSAELQNELLNLLQEEHQMGYALRQELEKRGWSPEPRATAWEIREARRRWSIRL